MSRVNVRLEPELFLWLNQHFVDYGCNSLSSFLRFILLRFKNDEHYVEDDVLKLVVHMKKVFSKSQEVVVK